MVQRHVVPPPHEPYPHSPFVLPRRGRGHFLRLARPGALGCGLLAVWVDEDGWGTTLQKRDVTLRRKKTDRPCRVWRASFPRALRRALRRRPFPPPKPAHENDSKKFLFRTFELDAARGRCSVPGNDARQTLHRRLLSAQDHNSFLKRRAPTIFFHSHCQQPETRSPRHPVAPGVESVLCPSWQHKR